MRLHPEASDSSMRLKTSVLNIFPQFTKSHVNAIFKSEIRNRKCENRKSILILLGNGTLYHFDRAFTGCDTWCSWTLSGSVHMHRRNFGITHTKSVHFAPIYCLNRQASRKITQKSSVHGGLWPVNERSVVVVVSLFRGGLSDKRSASAPEYKNHSGTSRWIHATHTRNRSQKLFLARHL